MTAISGSSESGRLGERNRRSRADLPGAPSIKIRSLIGIYGGTFDPVHLGHLRTALEVAEGVGLLEVRFLPCRVPPHRPPPRFSPEERLRFLRLALQDAPPFFKIDTRELEREGPSYMVDTLHDLREELGEEIPLALIVGFDAFLGLPSWHRWRELFRLAHLVVMTRAGVSGEPSPELREVLAGCRCDDPETLKRRPAGLVHFQRVSLLEISGTRIRQLLERGRSVQYLLPEPVYLALQAP